MTMDRIRMEPFVTREMQDDDRMRRVYERASARAKRRKRYEPKTGSMTAKISLCMALLACVILAETLFLKDAPLVPAVEANASEPRAAETQTNAEEAGEDETLGRLRFVENGGVKSVFAVSQRWDLPVAAVSTRSIEDATMLLLRAEAGEKVQLSASGEVRVVGEDETLGRYVRIDHGSGLESVYYHLEDIAVEEGQPLTAKDTLGRVHADGTLYFEILRDGEALDPERYLNTDAPTDP